MSGPSGSQVACAEPSSEDLDEQEIIFLEDIHQLMQAAHFRLLSADDWKTAQAEQFTVSFPREDSLASVLCFISLKYACGKPSYKQPHVGSSSPWLAFIGPASTAAAGVHDLRRATFCYAV